MNSMIKILAWLADISLWIFCLIPVGFHLPAPINRADLFYHGMGYLVLSTAFAMAYPQKKGIIATGLILQGILIEIIQPYTGRMFEFYDMLANTLGVVLGMIIWISFLEKLFHSFTQKFNRTR
jgi:VanZ family protein